MKKLIFSLFMVACFVQAADQTELTISWGVSERQGHRTEMEDRYAAVTDLRGNQQDFFFGIYDGHAGHRAAQAASNGLDTLEEEHIPPLHKLIKESQTKGSDCYVQAFEQMDSKLSDCNDTSGTTAVIANIIKNQGLWKLFLAWAGDSRGLLVDKEGAIVEETCDHKPNDENEKKRIEESGGVVDWFFGWRIGDLAVSRALGDKEDKEKTPQVIATPEVKEVTLDRKHKFLILACDGLWDVVGNEKAVNLLQNVPYEYQTRYGIGNEKKTEDGNDDQLIRTARYLRDHAYDKGSRDNISVLVARLDWGQEK